MCEVTGTRTEAFTAAGAKGEGRLVGGLGGYGVEADAASPGSLPFPLTLLPTDILHRILSLLPPRDVRAAASSCRSLHHAVTTSAVVPGMMLTLFPHQRAALKWMLGREGQPEVFAHPLVRVLWGGEGRRGVSVDLVNGEMKPVWRRGERGGERVGMRRGDRGLERREKNGRGFLSIRKECRKQSEPHAVTPAAAAAVPLPPPPPPLAGAAAATLAAGSKDVQRAGGSSISHGGRMVRDIRGGLFCDEPGLGKTITALSLILKTKGMSPAVPKGYRLVTCGRKGEHSKKCTAPQAKGQREGEEKLGEDNGGNMEDRKRGRVESALGDWIGERSWLRDGEFGFYEPIGLLSAGTNAEGKSARDERMRLGRVNGDRLVLMEEGRARGSDTVEQQQQQQEEEGVEEEEVEDGEAEAEAEEEEGWCSMGGWAA